MNYRKRQRSNMGMKAAEMRRLCVVLFVMFLLMGHQLWAQSFTRLADSGIEADSARTLGISWVDYDGDGDLDAFASNIGAGADNVLYRNLLVESGYAEFEKDTTAGALGNQGVGSLGNTWADVDNDGDLDVYTSFFFSNLFLNDGSGKFDLVQTGDIASGRFASWAAAWGDIDNDSYVDLVAVHPTGFIGPPQPNHLFYNNGDGTFTKEDSGASPITTGLAPYTVGSWSDYDFDGDLDLFIGSGPAVGITAPDFLYENEFSQTGNALFSSITDGVVATDARDGQVFNFVDIDNDRDLDVYVTNYWGGLPTGLPNDLYINDNGTYVKVTEGDIVTDSGLSLANVWGDYDNDGDLDVFVANEQGIVNRLYSNNGDGTFTAIRDGSIVNENPLTGSYGASAGDYDNDGDLDLIVGNGAFNLNGNANFHYRNDLNNGNSWINIHLIGTLSNKAAIGAKLWAKAKIDGKETWQFRDISAQNSFCGQNSLRAHFGFGDAQYIDSLVIQWPSGSENLLCDVPVNQFIKVYENTPMSAYSVPAADLVFKAFPRTRISTWQHFTLNASSDGINPATETVVVEAGRYKEAIAPGNFEAVDSWEDYHAGDGTSIWRYLDPRAKGIRAMYIVLHENGEGTAAWLAKRIDLSSTAEEISPDNVPFKLTIGNDNGSVYVALNESGTHWTVGGFGSLAKLDNLDNLSEETLPEAFSLHPNHPNPFNPTTTIVYELPETSEVKLTVYNMLGQEIRVLVSEPQEAGVKKIHWDGKNSVGDFVGSGVYLYKLQAGSFVQTRKMTLLK